MLEGVEDIGAAEEKLMNEFQLDRLDNDPVCRRLESARTEADGIFDVGRTVHDMAIWFQKAVLEHGNATVPGRHSVAELLAHQAFAVAAPGEVSTGASDPGLDERLVKAVTALLRDEPHEWRDVAAILYGKAIALVLAREFEKRGEVVEPLMTNLWSLGGHNHLAHTELMASLAQELRTHPRACEAYLPWLEKCVTRINGCPSEGAVTSEREAFDHFVCEWRQHPTLSRLWRDTVSDYFSVSFKNLDMMVPILMANPVGTLSILDKFRFPQPLEKILQHRSICYNHGLLEELLNSAPSCIREEDDGEWNGSLLAVLLLKTIDERCRHLWHVQWSDGAIDGDDVVNAALSSWIADLAGIVMSRKDGVFLGTQWFLLKMMDERLDRGRQGPDVLAQVSMIEWIGDGLAKVGLVGSKVAGYLNSRGGMDHDKASELPSSSSGDDRSPHLSALVIMAMIDCMIGNDQADVPDILEQLDILLVSRDRGFEEEAHLDAGITGFPACCMGYLLANEGDPAKRWKQSWRLLAEQRRAVQHWRQTKDSQGLAPSLFLISLGIAALDWLCSEMDTRRADPGALWRVVFDAARECWLTIRVTHLSERVENDIRRLFARHSLVFDSSNAKESPEQISPYSEVLANDLNALGGDDVLVAACCELLYRNRIAPSVLHHALQHNGGRGYALLHQFEQWQEVERDARKNTELAAAVVEMQKATLSALVEAAAHGETRRGKPRAVIPGIGEWDRLRDVPSFGRLLLTAPLEDADLPPRDAAPMRDIAL